MLLAGGKDMTIHHDKMAYGKLAPLREDFSEERLEAMAKLLSEGTEEGGTDAENADGAVTAVVAPEQENKDMDDKKQK